MTKNEINIDRLLTDLAAHARSESVPQVEVTQAVLREVASSELETVVLTERIWWGSAVGSLVAAGIAMMVGLESWSEFYDPAYAVIESVQVAMQ